MILTGITALLVFFYLILSGTRELSLFFLCLSPIANFIGFKRLLHQEAKGEFAKIAALRMISVIGSFIISLTFFSNKGEYFLVSLSVWSDFIFALLIYFILSKVQIKLSAFDEHFFHISFRNLLLGARPVIERILLVVLVSPKISGIYSLSSQIVMSSIGILTYSLNSLIQSEIAQKKINDKRINLYYLVVTVSSVILFPFLALVGARIFENRWSYLSSLVFGLGCAKVITIQNANRFNQHKDRFTKKEWSWFYAHILLFSVLVPIAFLANEQTAIIVIYTLSLLEVLIYCGTSVIFEKDFLLRLTLVSMASFVYVIYGGK